MRWAAWMNNTRRNNGDNNDNDAIFPFCVLTKKNNKEGKHDAPRCYLENTTEVVFPRGTSYVCTEELWHPSQITGVVLGWFYAPRKEAENVFRGKSGLRPPNFGQRQPNQKRGRGVWAPPNIWSRNELIANLQHAVENAAECRKMPQNAAEHRRTPQNTAECRRIPQNTTKCSRTPQNATKRSN